MSSEPADIKSSFASTDLSLKDRTCDPACKAPTFPLNKEQISKYLAEIGKSWSVKEEQGKDTQHLCKTIHTGNFVNAVSCINRIRDIAESLQHHPDLHLTSYKNLEIVISTFSAGNKLTINDFILAAHIEASGLEELCHPKP